MKIWIHRYDLRPTDKRFKARAGVLLKVEWAVGQHGFSDLHPWPEYGEPELEEHIASLASLQFTPLVENSLEANYVDRDYRLLKRNAFDGMILPRTHRLVTDIRALDTPTLQTWHKQGFSHLKVKMGKDWRADMPEFLSLALATPLMWRLDFNGNLKEAELTAWWNDLDASVRARIDYVEDPIRVGDIKVNGPWANDWYKQARAPIRVIKVAREAIEDLAHYDRLVFTHGMDHPLAQAYAVWAAARFYQQHPRKVEVCGLGAGDVYERDEFSTAWYCEGPRMKPTVGTGFGFDKLLESLPWQKVL